MTLKEFLGVMPKYGPLIHIADWGEYSDIEGDFGNISDVFNLKNDPEYAFLLDAEVNQVDFSTGVNGELWLNIEVYS